MAEVYFTADMSEELKKLIEQLKQSTLSESRVREIIREEIAALEKRQLHERRFGTPMNREIK